MKLKAIGFTFLVQAIIVFIFFVGGLLDPICDVYLALFYFGVIGSFLTYKQAVCVTQDKQAVESETRQITNTPV